MTTNHKAQGVPIEIVGQEVQRLRQAKGWTLAQLANRVGIDPFKLRDLELGKYSPGFSAVFDLMNALQVDVAELYRWRRGKTTEDASQNK